jgi:hypothetical protein
LIPEKYKDDKEIVRLTIEQIRKDLGSNLTPFIFSGESHRVFEELAAQISLFLEELHRANPSVLKLVLYRVDIPERDAALLLKKKAFFLLSEKIIRREFQKVLTRRYFSGEESK